MEKRSAPAFYCIALIPHRDCFPPLREYRRRLFAAGFDGAWSFPLAAPLAVTESPLSGSALKAAAVELRVLLGNRKLGSGAAESAVISGLPNKPGLFSKPGLLNKPSLPEVFVFGPVLDLPLFTAGNIPCGGKTLITAAVLAPGFTGTAKFPPPELSFRAAALTNIVLRPAVSGERGYSFHWELGPLYWLPSPSAKKTAAGCCRNAR